MKRLFPLLLALAAIGCDSARFDQLDEEIASERHTIEYMIEGTYAACTVTYADASSSKRTVEDVALPWSKKVTIVLEGDGRRRFDATVSATCADPARAGKSSAYVHVDGEMKARGSAAGFGATSQAAYALTLEAAL